MSTSRFKSSLIRRAVVFAIGERAVVTAEGRRQFHWADVPETAPYVGTRLAAVESRWVTWRVFGVPVWTSSHRAIELELHSVIGMFALYGTEHFTGLDAKFGNPLCKLGHDWLGTGLTPGICESMNLGGEGLDDEMAGDIPDGWKC